MDEGSKPIPTETLELGRGAEPTWWRRLPRGRRGLVITVVSLAAVGLGAFDLIASDRSSDLGGEPAGGAVTHWPRVPENFMALRQQHMNGFDEVTYAGIAVVVPEYWGRDQITSCGEAVADTVIYPDNPRRAGCRSTSELRHSSVRFIESGGDRDVGSRPTGSLDAEPPWFIREGPIRWSRGGYVQLVSVRDLNLRVVVRSPYRSVVERLTGTLRVAPSKQLAGRLPAETPGWTVRPPGGWVRSNTP